ncbi:MAG: PQQ-binding-like beta-propeller repeat protein, partial [Chitinispirillia bacterium]
METVLHDRIEYTKIINIRFYISPLLLMSFLFYSLSAANYEWPCFHGADRTNKSKETGLLKKWPEAGPPLVLTIEGLGEGYSSVSFDDSYIYTAGMINNETFVFAFDLNGKLIWKQPNGQSWEATRRWAMSYTGSRSTPTFDNNVIYHLGELGHLTAFNAKNGRKIWTIELRKTFDADIPEYGYSESVLVEGEYLYCSPAGKKGFVVCLAKKDGKTIWKNTKIPGTLGFNSFVIGEVHGYRQIMGFSSDCVFGIDMKNGTLLWKVPFKNSRSNNVADPILHNGHVFVSSGYGKGSALIKLTRSGNKIDPRIAWETSLMDNHHGGIILHEGYLYGSGHNSSGWYCLEFNSGNKMWSSTRGKGALTFAEGMLYCLEEKGTMKLIKASSDK